MAVSKRLRYEVLRRDNHTCRYCGAAAPDVKLTVDHVVPTTLGGADEASNLVAACKDCNGGKSSSTADAELIEDVDNDALRWTKAMKRASEIQAQEKKAQSSFELGVLTEWFDSFGGVGLPDDWATSAGQWFSAGLRNEDLMECIAAARRAKHIPPDRRWKWFCGCMWRRLEKRQQIAQDLLASGEVDDAED